MNSANLIGKKMTRAEFDALMQDTSVPYDWQEGFIGPQRDADYCGDCQKDVRQCICPEFDFCNQCQQVMEIERINCFNDCPQPGGEEYGNEVTLYTFSCGHQQGETDELSPEEAAERQEEKYRHIRYW